MNAYETGVATMDDCQQAAHDAGSNTTFEELADAFLAALPPSLIINGKVVEIDNNLASYLVEDDLGDVGYRLAGALILADARREVSHD